MTVTLMSDRSAAEKLALDLLKREHYLFGLCVADLMQLYDLGVAHGRQHPSIDREDEDDEWLSRLPSRGPRSATPVARGEGHD
jgi:hypothetical protein